MADPRRFFADNRTRISSVSDPVAHNTNEGLYGLVEMLRTELEAIRSENKAIYRELQEIKSRLR